MTLGDKIVIMDDGRIQQIGTPYEIFNEPVNQFVATFIGSPSTNLLDCRTVETSDGVDVVGEFFEFSLSGDQVERFEGEDGESLRLGIRPEYLDIDDEDALFRADVSVIEPHGSRDAVHLTTGGVELTAVTAQEHVARGTETVAVDIQRDEIWLFDGDGERVL